MVLFADTLPVRLVQIGQRDVIAKEEGVVVLIVFDLEGTAQAQRHLGHETELAAVIAAPDGVEGGVGELHPQRLVVPPLSPDGELPPTPAYL